MRILVLIPDWFHGHGGIARFNSYFLKALSQSPWVTSVVVLPRITRNKTREIKFGEFSPKVIWISPLRGKVGYIFRAFKTLWEKGPFHFIFCGHIHFAPLAALLARIAKIPFWLQLYGVEAWAKPSASLQWAIKQAKLVTAVSRHTRQKFLTWAELLPEKVRVLPGTFDERFHPGPKRGDLLERYGLTGKKIILTLSRLSSQERYKGHDRVIRILPRLLKRYPNLVYVIGGEGDERARFEAMVQRQGLDGAVRFIGEVKESELVDHYRMADLFVMPSRGEGFGIVFLEALACGVPVIAGNEDGSADALLEGEMGELVKPSDSQELFNAISKSLASKKSYPEAIERFSESHFRHWVEGFVRCL